MPGEKKYDVVVFETSTRQIDHIAGFNMFFDEGTHNAVRREITAGVNLNERFETAIVPAGKYKKGDTLNMDDVI